MQAQGGFGFLSGGNRWNSRQWSEIKEWNFYIKQEQ